MSQVLKIKAKDNDGYVITCVDNFVFNKAKSTLTVYTSNVTTMYQYAYSELKATNAYREEIHYEDVTFFGVDANNGAPMWVFEGTKTHS